MILVAGDKTKFSLSRTTAISCPYVVQRNKQQWLLMSFVQTKLS